MMRSSSAAAVVALPSPGSHGGAERVEVERPAGVAFVDDARREGRPALPVVLGGEPRRELLLGRAHAHRRLRGRRLDVAEELDQLLAGDAFDEVQDGHARQTIDAATCA